jgi:PD-(D/E)XK nuclease superfamily protein
MSLTTVQERTLVELMGSREERPLFPRSVAEDLTADLERRLLPVADRLPDGRQLWLTKGRLVNLHSRCEGFFLADELGEAVFTYGPALAVGKVVHKAVEVGVYARSLGEAELAERALDRLREGDQRFDEYAGLLDEVERAELLGEAVRQLSWFRTAFPPLERSWNPVVEWPVRVELAGGRVVLSARPDLVLGSADQEEPMRARRLVLELKGGQDRPEQDDDARFYALVMALHHGVPPFRVVTVNLQGGTLRPQDVTIDLLQSALHRVVDGAARAAALLSGEEPNLRPGKWCEWCPRSETCPVSSVRTSRGGPGG